MTRLLNIAIKAALQATYRSEDFQVSEKADASPLTLADRKALQVIKEFLSEYSLPILSEEGKAISYQEMAGRSQNLVKLLLHLWLYLKGIVSIWKV